MLDNIKIRGLKQQQMFSMLRHLSICIFEAQNLAVKILISLSHLWGWRKIFGFLIRQSLLFHLDICSFHPNFRLMVEGLDFFFPLTMLAESSFSWNLSMGLIGLTIPTIVWLCFSKLYTYQGLESFISPWHCNIRLTKIYQNFFPLIIELAVLSWILYFLNSLEPHF